MHRSAFLFAAVAIAAIVGCAQCRTAPDSSLLSTPVGSYKPETDISSWLSISDTVKDIKSYMTNGQFQEAYTTYVGSIVQRLGQGEGLSGPVFDTFSAYFGSKDFNDAYLMTTAFTQLEMAALAEMVEKTVQDAIPVQAVLSNCYRGAVSGDQAAWDACAAAYIGSPSSSSATIYERAEKRARNYGTFTSSGSAVVNEEVLRALNEDAGPGPYETVVKQIKIIYAQATVRYAFLLDEDMEDGLSTVDHRAEGQAFYRIIAPWLKAASPACDEAVGKIYNYRYSLPKGGMYCTSMCIPGVLGLSDAEFGTLERTSEVACA
eukprot:CAMPEP_0117664912 /NCGR_PEP_ID=MMETSP0804-20121206/9499_1 /TAXON_ID=1074897 /ORGANISM="Tetraselmis astigmatica, Strain CCMP880" /LENGTH=318 /DNA_ID=CAMNT_0005472229 /DNA_START=138 /DNA_END=1094 /DNA_ORIENTATION=+